MEITRKSKYIYTFDELEIGDIYSYEDSTVLYMKIKEGGTMKEMHFPFGVVQLNTPLKDEKLVRQDCKLTIYE